MDTVEETKPALIDTDEMCELLHVGRTALWKWRSSGKIPAPLQVSRRPLYWRRREIEDWIEAGMPPRSKWETLRQDAQRTVGRRRGR
jgi:predicted DNA-binding transcriptional regulator AlpA